MKLRKIIRKFVFYYFMRKKRIDFTKFQQMSIYSLSIRRHIVYLFSITRPDYLFTIIK